MKKSFYLVYSSKIKVEKVLQILDLTLDMSFTARESFYFGSYYKYEGLYCDSLKVFINKLPTGDLLLEQNDGSDIILKLCIDEGKNKDKLSKFKFLKYYFKNNKNFTFEAEDILEES